MDAEKTGNKPEAPVQLENIVSTTPAKIEGRSEFYDRHPCAEKAVTVAQHTMVGYGVAVMATVLIPGYLISRGVYATVRLAHNTFRPNEPAFPKWKDEGKWPWQKGAWEEYQNAQTSKSGAQK